MLDYFIDFLVCGPLLTGFCLKFAVLNHKKKVSVGKQELYSYLYTF